MSPKIPLQDSLCKGNCNCNCLKVEDALVAYQDAAEADDYLFGDYDYCSEWLDNTEG